MLWMVLRSAVISFLDHKCMKLSASLAYYTIFSLPPLLLLIISLCSIFYGRQAIQGEIIQLISGYVGSETAFQIQTALANTALSGNNIFATATGIIMLILGATGIFGEIQDSINFIWGLKTKPEKGWLALIINRLLSFSMILVMGFILLVSLTLNTFMDLFFKKLEEFFPAYIIRLVLYLDYAFIFIVIVTLFAMIFKILPDASIRWKHVMNGAIATGILFMAGKYLISYYLSFNTTVSAYGTTGSIIILLLWVYYSAIILYFGAEFTHAYARHHGIIIRPNKYAVFIDKIIVEKKDNLSVQSE